MKVRIGTVNCFYCCVWKCQHNSDASNVSVVGDASNASNANDFSNVSVASAPSDASVASVNSDAGNVSGITDASSACKASDASNVSDGCTASDAGNASPLTPWVMWCVDDACRQSLFPPVSAHKPKLIFAAADYFFPPPLHWAGLTFLGFARNSRASKCDFPA